MASLRSFTDTLLILVILSFLLASTKTVVLWVLSRTIPTANGVHGDAQCSRIEDDKGKAIHYSYSRITQPCILDGSF